MVIVKIWGGLGNQMFLYAFYRALLKRYTDCKMDISYYEKSVSHNGYELNRIFNLPETFASHEECQKIADNNLDLVSRIKRKTFLRKKSHYIENALTGYSFKKEIFSIRDTYFEGYFQSEKYFSSISDEIKGLFAFKNSLDLINANLAKQIKESNSVSIHIRRGDYLNKANLEFGLGEVCTLTYYHNAMKVIEKNVDEPKYFIFSDDISWCKKNILGDNLVFVENNKCADSYKDMQLMSLCKHNIIANSTFSWWGAWLNDYPEKIVVAPEKWSNNECFANQDIIPGNWVKVKVK